jgi:hypothetical protein
VRPRLVQIPRHLLHVALDDLPRLGVPTSAHDALRALLADLPLAPTASSSAQLVGPPSITLPCLAVVARHVGQGLRDHNLSIAHDRARLATDRAKLIFLTGDVLADAVANGDERPTREVAVFIAQTTDALGTLLAARDAAGLATFVTTPAAAPNLAHWRRVDLSA